MKVRKAVIPAAGLGTRFLPATKAMPKEMLPIVDKPTIQYIVEEAIKSGIEDIIIVTGKGKRSIEDHFDNAPELEMNLMEKHKYELLEKVQESSKVEIYYVRQKEPKGLGHAVLCAKHFIGNEPFAVLLGDDIVESETPCLKQMIDVFEETHASIVGVQRVPEEETHRYGIIDPGKQNDRIYHVNHFIEKPKQGTAPSNLAIIGRYILTPEIFMFLEKEEIGAGGEIQLTDAIQQLNEIQRVFAYEFKGERYDVGEKLGFITTTFEMALQNEELREGMTAYLKHILVTEEKLDLLVDVLETALQHKELRTDLLNYLKQALVAEEKLGLLIDILEMAIDNDQLRSELVTYLKKVLEVEEVLEEVK